MIEYVDAGGSVHGIVTIIWTTYSSSFSLIPSFSNVDGQQMGTAFTGSSVILTAPSGTTLSSPAVVYGVLPAGITLSLNTAKTKVLLSGTPTESGYFDVWIRVNGSTSAQVFYVYHRLYIEYTKPLVILTSSLPNISANPYSVTLQGYGGILPYTWSSSSLPSGLTLTNNTDNTATLSGTLSPLPFTVTNYGDLGTITFTLTDARGSSAAITTTLDLFYDNRLKITTPVIPLIPSETDYSFPMTAFGGTPPYKWEMANTPVLPTGITFDSVGSYGTTGILKGNVESLTSYSQSIAITVKDSVGNTSTGYNLSGNPYLIQVGIPSLYVNYLGIGTIDRGVPYQGILSAIGSFVLPITWQVCPDSDFPESMLPGLSLTANASNQGATATISGTYSGVPYQAQSIVSIVGNGTTATVTTAQSHGFAIGNSAILTGTSTFTGTVVITATTTGSFSFASSIVATETPTAGVATVTSDLYQIRIMAVDSNGNQATIEPYLTTGTDLTVNTTSLPNAVVLASYSQQLVANGGVGPYVWTIDPSSVNTLTGTGLSLSSSGVISGATTTAFSKAITFLVTDSLGTTPNIARATLTLTSQASGLTITTTSVTSPISGRAYSFQMVASGDANTPYTWVVSPLTANQLPTGLSISSTGLISGTTSLNGFSEPITFRVIDSIGAYVDGTFTVAVSAGLALSTGIDYINSTSTGILGYIDAGQVDLINPRPNLSFYVVATGVISTSSNQLIISISNANITPVVESITSGVALIRLTGSGFISGSTGINPVSISVTDSGVGISSNFTWVVFSDGILRIGATLPIQLTTAS